MVNRDGLARCRRYFSQIFLVCQHVDERRFSHVGAPDEGILRLAGFWQLLDVGVRLQKRCGFD